MPAQNLDKQPNYTIKLLNMEPGIPQNRSHQHLVVNNEESAQRSIRDVTMREWITVIILCFVNLINYMDRFTLAGILTSIQDYYHIGDSEGGLLQTAFVLSYMIFAPLFGYLGDRYSRRIIMAFGVFLWSLTTLIGSFMGNFGLFVLFRALVGIGEASYSTIAPTIISDLFVKDIRSKMLALFYFAIPVGSGLGYIVGSGTAEAIGSWQWGLRVTPILGGVAVLLIIFVLKDPERGQSEGATHLATTSWTDDLKDIVKNRSFMLSTAGFTCVAFVAGALAWWGPKFIFLGIKLQPGSEDTELSDVSYKFGILAMVSGLLGVPTGSFLAQTLRGDHPNIDPLVCAIGLIVSSPLIFFVCITCTSSTTVCFIFIFCAQFFLNLTWSIVADMLLGFVCLNLMINIQILQLDSILNAQKLVQADNSGIYVVVPTRRSTAEGFQLLVSHALGDAGSPYLIGILSDALKEVLGGSSNVTQDLSSMPVANTSLADVGKASGTNGTVDFKALQYSLFTTCFVEVLGGIFFLLTALYIVKDKAKADAAIKESAENERASHVVVANETETRTLMS